LEKVGEGFRNENFSITSLFFLDDGLVMVTNVEQASKKIRTITRISMKYGLELNKEKSNIIIYNKKNKPEEIKEIKVIEKIKYLGLIISDKRRMFEEQKKIIMEKHIKWQIIHTQ
jgi:hypothetical protein